MPSIPAADGRGGSGDALLEVVDLKTHFFTDDGVVKAVDGVSFDVRRGQTLCVVGESGCGKSVMARSILNLIDRPGRIVAGDVFLRDESGKATNLARLHPSGAAIRAIRGNDVSMIFQEPMTALSTLYTVGQQLSEVILSHLRLTKREARALAIEELARVGIPRPAQSIDAYSFELSGGMRQRAMIAMALVCRPKLLIADEPTTALDVTTQANILDLMRQLQRDLGMSVIFITHDLGVVAEIADEVAVMYLGSIVERGTVEQVFTAPKHPYTRALLRSLPHGATRRKARLNAIRGMVPHASRRPLGCSFHDRCDHARSGLCDRLEPPPTMLPGGHEVRCFAYGDEHDLSLDRRVDDADDHAPTPERSPSRQPLLEVHDLAMHFPITKGFFNRTVGHVRAVDGVSLTLYRGETLAIVGESGCGKTTLAHCIMRLHDPTAGSIIYHGEGEAVDLVRTRPEKLRSLRREIRMVFQDPNSSLNPRLRLIEIIGESLMVNGLARGRELKERVETLLEQVGLGREYLHHYPSAFSGGQRQRVGIARALAPYPTLIVADEAVSALDVSVQAQILNLLQELQSRFDLTYLFISHDLSVVAHISDRVAVMYLGKVVELANTTDLFARPKHPYTEALLSAVLRPTLSDRGRGQRIRLPGDVADASARNEGCPFHPRCRHRRALCETTAPPLVPVATDRHVACHFADELVLMGSTEFVEERTQGR